MPLKTLILPRFHPSSFASPQPGDPVDAPPRAHADPSLALSFVAGARQYVDELEMEVDEEEEQADEKKKLMKEKLWKLMCTYLPCDVLSAQVRPFRPVWYQLLEPDQSI